ncbi:hypothetical protein ONS95_008434 [Cadophora gregata]|uniref:uncharacterized protein n=1 Tax=Cadophora gregata TaxID=51156 RepID=UPI0026DB3B09|nr:uncharacterized protein ONS95_008434 [Cadophora gregata]KAK0100485.1 hypothetical protein ONS96_007761 [Cadophora gregata f. sp. sojae]KAK0126855.1 hypothetical protein ONS95_008434 [Cadophora gregata]
MNSSRLDLARQRQRCLLVSLSLTLLIIIWSTLIFPSQTTRSIKHTALPYAKSLLSNDKAHDAILSTQDLSHIARHVGTPTFQYAQRRIRTYYLSADKERPTLTYIDQPLLPDFQLLAKDNLTQIECSKMPPLTLSVALSPEVDTSILSFGISTKLTRLKLALSQLKHWLPHSNAQLHVSVPPEPSPSSSHTFQEIESVYRTAAINLTLHIADAPFAKSYFNLIKTLYEARTPYTQWLVLIDDDTFIPSLPYLVHHLSTHYNADSEILIAALSDSLAQIREHGPLPFGGGGIFISVPLAASLVRPEIWEACLNIPNDQGDQAVNECLNAHSSVRPTFDYELNQMDIKGDASGYFESGRRMLTIHHWRSWYDVDVPLASNVSKACGFECVFQRWAFEDDFVLSNGFSVVEYTKGIKEGGVRLEEIEKTWDGEAWNFVHHGGPLREPMEKGDKSSARLVEASVVDGVGVRQIYVERVNSGENVERVVGNVDRVVELLWLF